MNQPFGGETQQRAVDGVQRLLADYACTLRYEDLPADTVHAAKVRVIVDTTRELGLGQTTGSRGTLMGAGAVKAACEAARSAGCTKDVDHVGEYRVDWTTKLGEPGVENPIIHEHARRLIGVAPTQIIQPWQFGHGETKATCLWLKNLPQADWIIGVQIEGLKAIEAREKSKGKSGKSVPVSKTPPQAQALVSSGGSSARASGTARSSSQIDAMRNAMSKKGGVTANEAAQFLLARELAKTNR